MNLISAAKLLFVAVTTTSFFNSVNGEKDGVCSYQGDDIDIKGDGSLLLRQFINDDTVTVQLEYDGTEKWIGFAFSEQPVMVPNIAVIGVPATNTVLKYSLDARSPDSVPELDETLQTLTDTSIIIENGKTIMTFTKPLVEDNEQEVVRNDENNFIWAIGIGNTFPDFHGDRGSGTAQFIECGNTAAPVAAPTEPPPNEGAGRVDLGNGRIQFTLNDLEDGDLSVTLTSDENAGTITVDMVHANAVGWIGFAVSDDEFMPGSVAVIALPDDGTGIPQKYDLTGRVLPTLAPSNRQTLTDATYFQNDTHTGMTFTKLLQEDGEPTVTVDQNNFFLYALGRDNNFEIHGARSSFQLNFAEDNVNVAGGGDNKTLWKTHGILMALSWAILVPLGIASSILRNVIPLPDGVWFIIHRTFNSLGVLFTIIGFAIAVYLIADEQGDTAKHFQQLRHHKIGLTIFIFAFLQGLSGVLRPHLPHNNDNHDDDNNNNNDNKDDKDETNNDEAEDGNVKEDNATPTKEPAKKSIQRTIWEYQHKILGTVTVILGWYNCDSGIEAYNTRFDGPDLEGALWGVVAGIAFVTLILGVYQRFRS